MSLRLPGVLLALLTGLVGMLCSWSPDPLWASLWCVPAGCLLLGLGYESWSVTRAGLRMQLTAPAQWYLGRSGVMLFEFRHALARRVDLQIAPAAPADFSRDPTIRRLAVPAGASALLQLPCVPRCLGVHAWPSLQLRAGGPLGLAWWSRQLRAPCEVRVTPDLLPPGRGAAGVGAVGARSGPRLGAGAELLQLRRYRAGDSQRVIDWKATARGQRLVSRDFSEDQHLEIILLIDAGRASGLRAGELDRFGHYINTAARLAQYAVSLDDQVGLVLFADRPLMELAPARGAHAVTRLRRALSAARVEKGESNPLHAALRVRSLARQRSLVVLLTDLDDTTVAGQLASAARLLLPKHLPFVAGLSSGAAEALARSGAKAWLDPYRALAAQEYCLGLERKVRALRALGAPALVARPDNLERAVFDAYADFRRLRRV